MEGRVVSYLLSPFSHPQPSSIPFYASFDSRPPLVHPLFQNLCCFGSCFPEFNKGMYRYKFHQFLHFLFLYWYSEMEESGCCFSIVLNFCNLSTSKDDPQSYSLLFSLSTWNFLLSKSKSLRSRFLHSLHFFSFISNLSIYIIYIRGRIDENVSLKGS